MGPSTLRSAFCAVMVSQQLWLFRCFTLYVNSCPSGVKIAVEVRADMRRLSLPRVRSSVPLHFSHTNIIFFCFSRFSNGFFPLPTPHKHKPEDRGRSVRALVRCSTIPIWRFCDMQSKKQGQGNFTTGSRNPASFKQWIIPPSSPPTFATVGCVCVHHESTGGGKRRFLSYRGGFSQSSLGIRNSKPIRTDGVGDGLLLELIPCLMRLCRPLPARERLAPVAGI
jgi:hypothetical protein